MLRPSSHRYVYMLPKVFHIKSRDNISWMKAIRVAISTAIQGSKGSAELSRLSSTCSAGRRSSIPTSRKSILSSFTRKNSSSSDVEQTSQLEVALSEFKNGQSLIHEPSVPVIAFALEEEPDESTTTTEQ